MNTSCQNHNQPLRVLHSGQLEINHADFGDYNYIWQPLDKISFTFTRPYLTPSVTPKVKLHVAAAFQTRFIGSLDNKEIFGILKY